VLGRDVLQVESFNRDRRIRGSGGQWSQR
jgi:hypothetical protein